MGGEQAATAQVAVIIAVRNGMPFVNETVQTVLRQGRGLDRVIVVDDGSTDGTVSSLAEMSDPRLVVLRNPGTGVSEARNAGVAATLAPWLMFLDADDLLAPGAIDKLLGGRLPGCIAIYGDYERIDGTGHVIGRRGLARRRRRKPSGDVLPRMLSGNFIINGGVLICAREVFLAVGGFQAGLALCEDWLTWCRLASRGRVAYVAELVMYYRVHHGSVMMNRRRTFAEFAPALNAIYSDVEILSKVPAEQRAALRASGESSLMVYCAQQAARMRAWREAAILTCAAMMHSPRGVLRIISRVGSAVVGF